MPKKKKASVSMAIFSCQCKAVSRGSVHSAVAADAYREGDKKKDLRTGIVHDYTQRTGVEFTQTITPDRTQITSAELWNKSEAAEKRKDSQTAREWVVALPAELPAADRVAVAVNFAKAICDRYQVAATVAIHAPSKAGDERNYHAHILTTTRVFRGGELGENKLLRQRPRLKPSARHKPKTT